MGFAGRVHGRGVFLLLRLARPDDSHYDVLGVNRDATSCQIRQAFRKAAMKSHPDKCPDDTAALARFQRISTAYQILCDESSRESYDCDRDGSGSSPALSLEGFDELVSCLASASSHEALVKLWRPGMALHATLARGGLRTHVSIDYDGKLLRHGGQECCGDGDDEDKQVAACHTDGPPGYCKIHIKAEGGGAIDAVFLDRSLGAHLGALLVPNVVRSIPVVGSALTTAFEWVPLALLCMACVGAALET